MAQPTAPAKTSTNPNANPNKGAAPGTKDAKAEKVKVERVAFPGIPEGGLTSATIPTDFDAKLHKPLNRKDFANEADFFVVRADQYERQAKKLREQADIMRKTGGKKELVKVNRLKKMQEKMVELRKQLADQGLDIDALLAGTANGQ